LRLQSGNIDPREVKGLGSADSMSGT
jgi:hypothetical protein